MCPPVVLDLMSGTICRQTSDSQTCHAAISDSRWINFYLVSGTNVQCESSIFNCQVEFLLLTPQSCYTHIFVTVFSGILNLLSTSAVCSDYCAESARWYRHFGRWRSASSMCLGLFHCAGLKFVSFSVFFQISLFAVMKVLRL